MMTRRQFHGTMAGGLAAALLPRLEARAAGEPYKIGSIFSYTGPAAFLGDRMKRSVELFVEETNKKGGISGHPLELFLYDAGTMLGLKGFAAAVTGGLGNTLGGIAGGLVLGLLEALGGGLIASEVKDVLAFVLLLFLLFFRPRGLFGRADSERV